MAATWECGFAEPNSAGAGHDLCLIGAAMTLPPIVFDADEVAAMAEALSAAATQGSLPQAAKSALRKLFAAATSDPPERLAPVRDNVVTLPTATRPAPGEQVDPAVRDAVQQAVQARRAIRFGYTDGHGKRTVREVEPAGVLAASGRWYLIGWDPARQDGRGFRLDRVADVEITGRICPPRDLPSVLGPLSRGASAT